MAGEKRAIIEVKVIPSSSREKIEVRGELVIVRVSAPPEKGRANERLIEIIAEKLGISKKDIEMLGGEKSRRKLIGIMGISQDSVFSALKKS